MIRFACPNCRNPMKADRAAAGQTGLCQRCGQPVTVPLASSVASPEPDKPAGPARRQQPWPRVIVWALALFPISFGLLAAATSNSDINLFRAVIVAVCSYCLARALDRLIGD